MSMGLATVWVVAEYPGTNNFMKRVVFSDESSDVMFTSNILTRYENNKVPYQPYYVGQLTDNDIAQSYDVEVYIWNYDINGSGEPYKKEIKYDLDIAIVDNHGDVVTGMGSGKYVQIVNGTGTSVLKPFNSSSSSYTYQQLNETLEPSERTYNKYIIRFSKSWNLTNDVNTRVQIKATPKDDFPDLKPLAAAIGLKEESSSESTGWKYYVSEQRLSSAAAPSAYDGYNLVLTGTGSENIVIEWDPAKIELNKKFYEQNGAFSFVSGEVTYTQNGGSVSGWDKLVISANSYDATREYRNRYDIQFYKASGEISNSWNFIADSQATGVYMTLNIPSDSES